MSYRIFMTINRGMTDSTAVCVFPWERPLLEEVHGTGATVVSIEEMASLQDAKNVKPIKMPTASAKDREVERALDLRQQLEAMVLVESERDPKHDLATEFGRLVEKYGMHPDVNMSVAEKFYSNYNNFRRLVRPYLGSKPPAVDPLYGNEEDDDAEDETRSPAEMSIPELKAALKEQGVKIPAKANRDALIELCTDALAQAA